MRTEPTTILSEQDRLVRRILRVNHAGEHGAVAIYGAQIKRARPSPLLEWLKETISHEKRHREVFRDCMPSRNAKPCRAMAVWSVGGWLLGSTTALLGSFGILVCTAAVERTVHQHLIEQISYLSARDEELASRIREIIREEDEHLAYAEARHDINSLAARLLSLIVRVTTEALIWVSTRGDSLNLRAAMRAGMSS